MEPYPEYPLFLVRILEELDNKHNTMSYQDLCKSLCVRFNLVHLAKLRSLLFYTACLDPAFPATVFKDKMRCSMDDPQSKKLLVAADIVTMFNLIQMNGGKAKDKLPTVHKAKFQKNHSVEVCRSDAETYKFQHCEAVGYEHMDQASDRHHLQQHSGAQSTPSGPKSPNCSNHQQFVPTSDPNFHLGLSKDLKYRAASLDKLQHLPLYPSGSPPFPAGEMQSTYFPMEIYNESITDQEPLEHISNPEPFSVHSCAQKRNIFKEDLHNFMVNSPQVCVHRLLLKHASY